MNKRISQIFSALMYEGILSVLALILYFYVEPRFDVETGEKGFFSSKNICAIVISIPFMQFLVGFIFQSKTCEVANNYLCFGYPDILQHSLFYDIFFLRVNDTFNGAHWIDYMYIPILYFITWAYTKDPFFSALNAGFMVFIHEFIWFIFYWFKYYPQYQFEGWYNDIAFFMLVCTLGFIGIKKYGKFYRNICFTLGIFAFIFFLEYWYSVGFTVSVINNTQLGNSRQFLITQWYNDPLTNMLEVISWTIVFLVFIGNLWYVKKFTKMGFSFLLDRGLRESISNVESIQTNEEKR